jgi:signal transduction histidine kinase
MKEAGSADVKGLGKYLSPLQAWAMSFGCAVGWGAFIMPGTTFLPIAGPLGTLIGLGLGALVMFIIGRNYHYLIQSFPEAGGANGYVKHVCGGDHGYICGWFLILTYVAIAWANATALALIGRHLLGEFFIVGFNYHVAGYGVFAGEILLSISALLLVCGAFLVGKRLAARLQAVFALVFCVGIAVCATAVFAKHAGGISCFAPAFAKGHCAALQVFAIVVLAPWAFVGFESVSHSAEEFAFPRWKTVGIIVFSLLAATAAYFLLTLVGASTCPPGFANWRDYIAARGTFDGLEALPVFYATKKALGGIGLAVLGLTAVAAIVTGLIGHVVAASRLLYAMAKDGLLWGRLARLDRDGSPRNAIVAIIAVSCLIPFVGRTAVRWIVDVTTIGASIAYGYVSFCTVMVAKKEGRQMVMVSGFAGLVISAAFMVYFLVPNFWVVEALAPESYFILSSWSIVGIVVFRIAFGRDKTGKLGASTAAWLVLLFFILFAGHMWNRQMERNLTNAVVSQIGERYALVNKGCNATNEEAETFLERQKDLVDDTLTRYNLIQIVFAVIALAMMYSIYSVTSRRERDAAKAKSYFFSTISHDIRTPLNAIVGFSQMLRIGFRTDDERKEAIDSILIGSKSLLDFVNDILDLSRRESGDSELSLLPTDCRALLRDVEEAFRVGTPKKGVEIRAAIGEMPQLLVDPLLLRHIVSNLVSNAVKFTERGYVEVRGRFDRDEGAEADSMTGTLRVEIEDTGVGFSDEDKEKIGLPYTQIESKIARNGGTGLSLAICRQFAEEMGGAMSFVSELGKGSTFSIVLPGVRVVESGGVNSPTHPLPHSPTHPSTLCRLLLVDDQKMNLTVLKAMIKRVGGFEMETAADGKEALARLKDVEKPAIDAVLTDMWMPELDGEGLAKAIRADPQLAKLPVHVISADVELQANYAEKGFDGIILKPVTVGTLGPLLAGLAERNG